MPRVDLICDSGLFYESNVLGIMGISDPMYFGERTMEVLEMKTDKKRQNACP